MRQLIEITSVPIEIRMKTTNASLEYTRGTAEMEISRTEKGLDIKSRPIKLQVDTFEARSSMVPTTTQSVEQSAQSGQQAAYEATATYAQHGKLLLNAKLGQDMIKQFAKEPTDEQIQKSGQVGLDFIPKEKPEIDWEDGDMEIRYEMDKLNVDWKIDQGEFKFTPGDIEISVERQPEVIIKYTGGPIYVPRSADPNYEPVDVHA
ncbi:MAG: hypothetical protein E7422_05965 [Ruminococcaceae bacterium]|jgi:hypothetical protein|nr:hypothetical protein [Oscillospiraceae bacterium]